MKILWLYKYLYSYDFDDWLHMKFAEKIDDTEGFELRAYGPDIHRAYPNLCILPYDSKVSLAALHERFAFDIVIANTKSRMFEYYDPHKEQAIRCWLPSDFRKWRGKKVMLEEDYHYEKNDSWYIEMNFSLILQRHFSQVSRQNKVPMKWYPFSVDTKLFHDGAESRIERLAFVGNSSPTVYRCRHRATEILTDCGLCDSYRNNIQIKEKYPQVLRKYIGYISCGSIYEICAAKNFEIMASGGVLFTNRFKGIHRLFDPDCYCAYVYKDDKHNNIVEMTQQLVSDSSYRDSIRQNAFQCIQDLHTHEIRIEQLNSIL